MPALIPVEVCQGRDAVFPFCPVMSSTPLNFLGLVLIVLHRSCVPWMFCPQSEGLEFQAIPYTVFLCMS